MEQNSHQQLIIVGGGCAAAEMVTGLREQGWSSGIVLVSDEPHLPYQRPPLSKAFLDGSLDEAALLIKSAAAYAKAGVELVLSASVAHIDRAGKRLALADGRNLPYGKLALATGGRARPLPGEEGSRAAQAHNFYYLRSLGDAQRLRTHLQPGAKMVIVGGGYVGLEVAATARKHGLHVTVLEAMPRVLARVTSPELSAFFERCHRAAGVDILTGTLLKDFDYASDGDGGERIVAAHCANGSRLLADVVVVGIGLLPNTELAQAAGLRVDNGIVVDEQCRTDDADIVAAGDCTSHPSAQLGGKLIRLESVPNAMEQARTAAATLCGKHRLHHAVPWFWSDQYDLKLKSVGLSEGYGQIVLRGDMDSRAFALFYLRGSRVVAADTVNRPQDFMMAKRLVGEAPDVDPKRLADLSEPLANFLKRI